MEYCLTFDGVQTFLQQIIESSGVRQNTSDMLFVFPNRRACLHFKKELASQVEKPIWSPAIISLADLIQEQYHLPIADPLTLTFELFQVYNTVLEGGEPETIDNFFPWGSMMLRDFDEADRYLLNAEQLFREIRDLRNLEALFQPELNDYESFKTFWRTFANEPISDVQQKFAHVWNRMGTVYKAFRQHLNSKNLAYEGMAYRHLAEHTGWIDDLPYRNIYLCGFNALSASEEFIFQQLVEKKGARICWDVDPYYLNNPEHEAGHFIRSAMSRLPKADNKWLEPKLTVTAKKIQTLAVAGQTSQTQVASLKLQELMTTADFDPQKTAIVLPNEGLLQPLLHALPITLDQFNVTMGYPLQQTNAFSFVESFLNLHRNRKTDQSYSHRDVTAILAHPYTEQVMGEDARKLIEFIQNNQLLRPKADQLVNSESKLTTFLFQPKDSVTDLIKSVREILLYASQTLEQQKDQFTLEMEFILQFYKMLQRLGDLLLKYGIDFSPDVIQRLIRQLANSQTLPFSGEPLGGLQIMGLLETRALDFRNVIILSANEGYLPATKPHHSYIPYQIRKAFGLPTFDQQDGLFAYNVYRLMQRAENITFIYSTDMAKMNEGEPSRYLKQIAYELAEQYPNVQYSEGTIHIQPLFAGDQEIIINKEKEVLEKLERFKSSGGKFLSPSSIATYINCSLQFYFNYVLELREADELEEDLDAIRLGNIFHQAMEDLYGEKIGQPLQPDDYRSFKSRIDEVLLKAYRTYYSASMQRPEGKNVLNYEFLKKAATRIFDEEMTEGITVTEVETREYSTQLPIQVNGDNFRVHLGGIFDRVDQLNGITRIIDYKTGGQVKLSPKILDDPTPLFEDPNLKANLQGMIYAMLYLDRYPEERVEVGFYHLRELKDGLKRISDTPIDKEALIPFRLELQEAIGEIFNPDIPFSQTEDVARCTYCPFNGLCQR